MALETGVTYIEDLVTTNPPATDTLDESDNHHRIIKTAVKGSFPNLGAAAVTKTAAEINDLAPLTETMIILDEPQSLLSTSTATSDWTQVDMSAQYAAAATAGARAAILKCYLGTNAGTSAGRTQTRLYIQKRGAALTKDGRSTVIQGDAVYSAATETDLGYMETTVNLDSNSDFDYHFTWSTTAGSSVHTVTIYLVGYYV